MAEITATLRQRRRQCPGCNRPMRHCLCSLIPDIAASTQVLVIQHPSEQRHALNTARLLVAGVRGAKLLIAEQLTEQCSEMLMDPAFNTELLFPGEGAQEVSIAVSDHRPRRLVLLDGTWRKARKILHLNPVLQNLPRVALPAGLISHYRLRKAPGPGALSTLEAGMHALQLIEPSADFSALLVPFDALIDGQIQAMGPVTYQRNYLQLKDE